MLPELSAFGHFRGRNGHNTEVESDPQQRDEFLLLQQDGDLVDGRHIADDEDLVDFYGAVQGELGNSGICKRRLATTGDLEFDQQFSLSIAHSTRTRSGVRP